MAGAVMKETGRRRGQRYNKGPGVFVFVDHRITLAFIISNIKKKKKTVKGFEHKNRNDLTCILKNHLGCCLERRT